jgi:folate-dependent phosphoribosylglycinamide formyltransferase PurN
MRHWIYTPKQSGPPPVIAFFISGSGTNYQQIVAANPHNRYVVFTNRPGCEGARNATAAGHTVIELSHHDYLEGAREKYGLNKVPRNCPERTEYEKRVSGLLEEACGGDVF